MLEVRGLTKIYKEKKRAEVRALDDITLQFPKTGMVFLLGKSGSGKSTLLNVCGGLDEPTEGEILIKGKSSKDFTQSDFDSYRNTYVGFVFQEYNILNEFTVEDNIGLALELQGKPKDEKVIDEILKEVDLAGFAKRKPNTLSGGQKQRVAIARALVKMPEIIMADEPTGALDSETGRQVLETLKRLSQDKLVLVVSHDREFAQKYGDRIIELKDGKVVSDMTKVSSDEDVFVQTNENDIEKEIFDPEKTQFIPSKLPARHAVKMGLSSLKSKPIRLVFTILLCSAAFAFFGLFSTLTFYDGESVFKETMGSSGQGLLRFEKVYEAILTSYEYGVENSSFDSLEVGNLSDEDIETLKNQFDSDAFGGVLQSYQYNVCSFLEPYWINQINSLAYLPEDHSLRDSIIGNYPANKDEICISSYTADIIVQYGAYDSNDNPIEVSSSNELIGKTVKFDKFNNATYKVVGIFDSGSISSKYDVLKTSESKDEELINEFRIEIMDGLYLIAFVSQDRIKTFEDVSDISDPSSRQQVEVSVKGANGSYSFTDGSSTGLYYRKFSEQYKDTSIIYFDEAKETLADNEAVIDLQGYSYILGQAYSEKENYTASSLCNSVGNRGENVLQNNSWVIVPWTEEVLNKKVMEMLEMASQDNMLSVGIKLTAFGTNSFYGDIREFKIVGIIMDKGSVFGNLLVSDSVFTQMWDEQKVEVSYYIEQTTNYKKESNDIYNSAYVIYEGTKEQTDAYWKLHSHTKYDEDDSRIRPANLSIQTLIEIDELMDILSKIFLYGGLVFAIFASLLLSNFISVSISSKQKDIGILRAIGARGSDLFKIFFSESLCIAAICVVLSMIVSIIGCSYLNGIMITRFDVALFIFGIPSVISLSLIAVFTTFIATFLPVQNAAKKKPVESIRAL